MTRLDKHPSPLRAKLYLSMKVERARWTMTTDSSENRRALLLDLTDP